MTDFFETTSDDNQFQKINRKKRKFWLIPINYTVASYYPFGNFFYDIIVDVIGRHLNKIKRLN